MTAPSPARQAHAERAAEADWEQRVEAAARAMFDSDYDGTDFRWEHLPVGPDLGAAYYRRLAAAALTADDAHLSKGNPDA